jgi:death-on-curing protein
VQELIWIFDEVVVAIHRRQLAEHGGLEEIRDEGLLQSALLRPKNILAYSESSPDMAFLAAAYAYGIVKNHPFVDGNKRTAYVVMRTFLKLHGYDIQASSEEKYQIWLALAASKLSEKELAEWIRKHLV